MKKQQQPNTTERPAFVKTDPLMYQRAMWPELKASMEIASTLFMLVYNDYELCMG